MGIQFRLIIMCVKKKIDLHLLRAINQFNRRWISNHGKR